MRIGVISDTHDRLDALERAFTLFQERSVEAVIHAGDLVAPFAAKRLAVWGDRLSVIYGNNDGEREGLKRVLPQIQDGPLWVGAGGKSILVHHHVSDCTADDLARADVVITGHTHAAGCEKRGETLFLNPGECCGWVGGRCTVAILETEPLTAEIIEVTP